MMDQAFDFFRHFGWLAAILVNLVVVWAGWSLRHKFVTREDCTQQCAGHAEARAKMSQLLAKHDSSVQALTLKLESIPDSARLHSIELQLANIRGEQGRLTESLRGIRDIMERVEGQTTLLMRGHMGGDKQ